MARQGQGDGGCGARPWAAAAAASTAFLVEVVVEAIAEQAPAQYRAASLRSRGPILGLLAIGGLLGAALALAVPAEVSSWGFVIYIAVTIIDVLARPGFLRSAGAAHEDVSRPAIPTTLGAPIGAIASFLGVGGSVMTVPLLRRAGLPMGQAAALANPLTLEIGIPAAVVFLAARHAADIHGAVLRSGLSISAPQRSSWQGRSRSS
ncbi:sulfite exporter TauE/SafE family protein [Nocardia testacea]|uniref:sulfite exporter TauE/SafE family protein n=1 Tax=Nocardia testacea TaxID=248551 RepID=UPI0033C70280